MKSLLFILSFVLIGKSVAFCAAVTDTVSKKIINIYPTKGMEAEKVIIILRKQVFLDPTTVILQDTTVLTYKIVNQLLPNKIKGNDKEVIQVIRKYEQKILLRRMSKVFFGLITIVFFSA